MSKDIDLLIEKDIMVISGYKEEKSNSTGNKYMYNKFTSRLCSMENKY